MNDILQQLNDIVKNEGMEEEDKIMLLDKKINEYIAYKYPTVGDLSQHPITPTMGRIKVTANKVSWIELAGEGMRTPLQYDKVADKEQVELQLQRYM